MRSSNGLPLLAEVGLRRALVRGWADSLRYGSRAEYEEPVRRWLEACTVRRVTGLLDILVAACPTEFATSATLSSVAFRWLKETDGGPDTEARRHTVRGLFGLSTTPAQRPHHMTSEPTKDEGERKGNLVRGARRRCSRDLALIGFVTGWSLYTLLVVGLLALSVLALWFYLRLRADRRYPCPATASSIRWDRAVAEPGDGRTRAARDRDARLPLGVLGDGVVASLPYAAVTCRADPSHTKSPGASSCRADICPSHRGVGVGPTGAWSARRCQVGVCRTDTGPGRCRVGACRSNSAPPHGRRARAGRSDTCRGRTCATVVDHRGVGTTIARPPRLPWDTPRVGRTRSNRTATPGDDGMRILELSRRRPLLPVPPR